jgi:hypothetical protein
MELRLWAGRPNRDRFSVEERHFSRLRYVYTRLGGLHNLLYNELGGGALSLRLKRKGSEADDPPPSCVEVRNCGAIPPLIQLS